MRCLASLAQLAQLTPSLLLSLTRRLSTAQLTHLLLLRYPSLHTPACRWCLGSSHRLWRKTPSLSSPAWQPVPQPSLRAASGATSWRDRGACASCVAGTWINTDKRCSVTLCSGSGLLYY